MTVEVSVSSGKPCAAEAPESELSWATGSGLPICCISGLAVAEESRGSRCRALEEATVSKLFDNNYWIFTKWLCGHETCRRTDSVTTVVCIYGGKKQPQIQMDHVIFIFLICILQAALEKAFLEAV